MTSHAARGDEPAALPAPPIVVPDPRPRPVVDFPSAMLFLGGAATGLALHETGHVVMNLAYGNVPGLGAVSYGRAIPWFYIDARLTLRDGVYYKRDGSVFRGGARVYYYINMAGFLVQNIGADIILASHPRLRYEHAPFEEGVFWMDVGLSIGYAAASFAGIEDPHGDISGGARHSQYPHQFIASMVMTSGVLDMFCYLFPDNDMLLWLSRSAKVMFLGMGLPVD
ncbi:MAG: hypothetical protein ACRELB_02915 [Polyangiaceae bacterium]